MLLLAAYAHAWLLVFAAYPLLSLQRTALRALTQGLLEVAGCILILRHTFSFRRICLSGSVSAHSAAALFACSCSLFLAAAALSSAWRLSMYSGEMEPACQGKYSHW